MEQTLEIINKMKKEGLFSSYAIGGGIAALFYIEPITTFDLDIFIILTEDTKKIISLAPIYSWLKQQGYKPEKEQVMIEGIPVQLIPTYNDLIKDGVLNASKRKYGKVTTMVLLPEYLIAIMLQTMRPKDIERLIAIFDNYKVSQELLDSILSKHNLTTVYKKFMGRYYGK
jgi:hypothetical protein